MGVRAVALTVSNVSKTFGGTRALREVGLTVRRGEVHAVVGHNGSGKSTLIKILAGYHRPDGPGRADVAGVPFQLGDPLDAHRVGLRFVHQDLGLVAQMGAIDNISLGSAYQRSRRRCISWRRQAAFTRHALHRLGHRIDIERPVAELAPVERTAVAIARAMQDWSDTGVLVLDEPTATMPAPEATRLLELIRTVCANGAGVLFVSHHLDEVFAVADRVTVLRDGSRVGTFEVRDTSPEAIAEVMLGRSVAAVGHGTERSRREVVLRARGLSGSALDAFDLDVHAGEIVGVAGLLGSGREELCGLLYGADRRDGSVVIDGREVPSDRPDVAARLGVGLVPADRHRLGLVLPMNIRENLSLADMRRFRSRTGLRLREESSDAGEWVARLGIRSTGPEQAVTALSGGNQQKVVLGKWLRARVRVLLLDEPSQGVDVGGKADLHRSIVETADAGSAVVVCSSDESELAQLCHRVLVLRKGVVVAELAAAFATAEAIAHQSLGSTAAGNGAQPGNGSAAG